MTKRFSLTVAFLVVLLLLSTAQAQKPDAIETAFQKFWAARSPVEAEKIAPEVIKSRVSFDEAVRRLKEGRKYGAEKTGVVKLTNKTSDSVEHNYALNIPGNYDPARR